MIKPLCFILCIILTVGMLSGCSGKPSVSGAEGTLDTNKIGMDVKDANSGFAFRLFNQLNKEDKDKNIFISPLSVSTALTMTYEGARTTTKEAVAKALGYTGIDDNTINENYRNLLRYLNNTDRKVDLKLGNSLWIREGQQIEKDFISINKDIFGTVVTDLDFSKKDAADHINKWISDATNKKIDKMIDSPIPSDIVMYLINAIYFKGDWTKKFDKKSTYSTQFNAGDGSLSEVMMMSRNGKIEYGRGDDYKAVRLPYGSGKIAMYCILPETKDMDSFISGLDENKWKALKDSISEEDDVQLKIPKFKLEYGIKNLNESLTALGMGEAFGDTADFTGIREGICISRVLHKALIEVNEEGSEAAAATVVEMRETAYSEPLTFIADRPFMFIISDDETGTILFMGKLYDIK